MLMHSPPAPGSDNPKEALAKYVDQLHTDYENWYGRSKLRIGATWQALQLLSYLSGFAAAILSAVGNTEKPLHRFWMVVLPLIGSFSASMIVQFRLYELTQMREHGRICFQTLVEEARRRLAAAATLPECTQIHAELASKANEIEAAQSQTFFGLFRRPEK